MNYPAEEPPNNASGASGFPQGSGLKRRIRILVSEQVVSIYISTEVTKELMKYPALENLHPIWGRSDVS